ncbi:MAG: glycoside hydrolase family 20 protein [Rhodanobacteraceae bacterium]
MKYRPGQGWSNASSSMASWIWPCIALLLFSVAAHARLNIIPKPQHAVPGRGAFKLRAGAGIAAPQDPRAQWIAGFLRDAIRRQTGIALNVAAAGTRAPIALRIDPAVKGDEAYRLEVTPSQVTITAADDRGLFWGVQTLRQLLPLQHSANPGIPAVSIDDAPRYPWRGVMLDVSRHFYPVSFIKKLIDLMSYDKLDVFHWHLTDDQGWRIQIKRYPKLTSVGAWRIDAEGHRHGGYYTQAQIRDVVAYARQRNVMVVPEIEMPGHTTAAIAAYPELSCSGKPAEVLASRGGTDRVDCIDKTTFTFFENVLDEVMALFPSPYVHIGADEVPQDAWADCASCEQLAKTQGLVGEPGLHGYFVRQIQNWLSRHGKTMIGWDEILQGGMDTDAVVEVWHGDQAAHALANGNRIILAGPFYLNQVAASINDRTMQDLHRSDPLDKPIYLQHPQRVLGGEAPLWGEMATPMNAMALLYPRLLAIAEHFWNPQARDWPDFLRRARIQEDWLASQDVTVGPEDKDIVDYRASFDPLYKRWRISVVRGFDDMRMHYTTNGSEPNARSPWFGDVLDLYAPTTIAVAPFRGDWQYADSRTFRFVHNLALGDPVSFATLPARDYSGGPLTLTDGILGVADMGTDFRDGTWDGWKGGTMDASIDLQQPTTLHSIDARFLQYAPVGILLPRDVWFETSDDGKQWTVAKTVALKVDPNDTRPQIRDVTFSSKTAITTRYVRVVAAPWQPADGSGNGWIFSDEIIVR